MVKQRQKTKKNRTDRGANVRDLKTGVVGTPVAWPGSSAINPGRAHVRMVTEVFSSDDARFFSKTGFSTWSSQVDGILSPYRFFRVCRADCEVVVAGGAASTYSVAFNVSNSSASDTGASAVLNDDYSGVSTALIRPKLAPPKAYWEHRPLEWYTYTESTSTSYTAPTCVAGVVSLSGSGGASSSTVIGYLVTDLVIEFHTLI
nr:hypothetical protein [Tolivirales sp.]